ncbi:MAG: RNA-binding transcriptional accessory protein [Erysipelotrichaceae bacterium]|nr:RNA-binding transcriptional accessory protein [Erysipelotrichaceae bacterium]
MNNEIIQAIAKKLKITVDQVNNTLSLLEEGNTVPFIARYRKEATHNLDEEQILYIEKQYTYEVKLAERKEAVLKSIEQQGKLTDEIRASVMECTKLSQVEDVYRPYVQKKKTRAAVAIKNGLQPLADWMLSLPESGDVEKEAEKYLSEEVKSTADAIQGAKDIIAEFVSDNAQLRWEYKEYIETTGMLVTKLKKDAVDEKHVYEMYYDRKEKVSSIADHRVMAIDRAEKEKVINATFEYDVDYLVDKEVKRLLKGTPTICASQITEAVDDGLKRLLFPSVEREIRSDLSERAQNKSIEIFSLNLEKLLLQAPLKGRVVLGFDPAFRTGCKLAVLDETGKMLKIDKIYPHEPQNDVAGSRKKLLDLISTYNVKIIAIGNGTASRESEKLVADLIRDYKLDVSYAIVSEAGASVYSASDIARAEFPDLHVEERSAVSIGRRLLDPLAELIKIDPKSIGVGQYQHDLPEKALNERLDEAIMKAVNRTGADLNTASPELLTHISGLNSATAKEIVNYRNENGRFTNREQLKKVKKLGEKTFQQCAGFLRIVDGDEPLDQTSIHPESYELTRKLMKLSHVEKLGQENIEFDEKAISELGIDAYTLKDIEDAIRQPLRDYRDQFDGALLKSDVLDISNLHKGDSLSGTVRNVVDFGAFVDIGLHDDGLIHVTRLSMNPISHPSDVVSVGDIVTVYVYEVDEARGRVQLSLLPLEQLAQKEARQKEQRNRSFKKPGNKNKNNNKNNVKSEKPKKESVSMEEATRRLMERFGK